MDGLDLLAHVFPLWDIVFWLLLLCQWAIFSWLFCGMNILWNRNVKELGIDAVTLGAWVIGFAAMGMPVIQAGLWIESSHNSAWVANIAPLVILVFAVIWGL